MPTAANWDLTLWRHALRMWNPTLSPRLLTRCDQLAAVGRDVRPESSTVPDVAAARRNALDGARRALTTIPPGLPGGQTLTTRLQVDLVLAAPLASTDRSWLSEAIQRGVPLNLGSPAESTL